MDGSLPTGYTVSYDLIKALDFPMEDIPDGVEDEDGHEISRNIEPPATPPSFDAWLRPTIFNVFKKPSTLYEQTSHITQISSVAAKSKLASSAISNAEFFPSTSSNSSPSENVYRLDASESDFEASLTEEMSNPVKRNQKQKRNSSPLSDEEMTKLSSDEPGESREIKRCTHCAATKTSMWRKGPQGPRTLCSACGVYYRSGCLFPDYRPPSSSTFSSEGPGESRENKRCTNCGVTRIPMWEGPNGPKTLCYSCGIRYRSICLFPENRPAASATFSSDKPGPGESRETKRCTQCAVTKTRQWREGPLGPKTLCNACGARYRCRLLFAAYHRPAKS